jgi:hypothetical protein
MIRPTQPPLRGTPRWVLHPTLLAAAFVLEVALANKIEPAGFVRALVVAVSVGGGLTVVCWALARNRWIGGLVASVLVGISISIIPFFFVWEALRGAFGPAVGFAVLGVAVAAAMAVPAIQLIRVRGGARLIRGPATAALNRFATILVGVVILLHAAPDMPGAVASAVRERERETVTVRPAIAPLPDIYVVLVDGYPRADVLQRRLGIDNSAFLGELRTLGFDVATNSHSNYVFTQLTLASMFQMRHLEQVAALAPLIGNPGAHVNALRNALIESPAFAALHAAGYQIVATQPGYEHVALRSVADRVLEHGEMNDLERDVLKRTWLLDPVGAIWPTLFTGPPRDRVVNAFDDLGRLAAERRSNPVFAWVHVPAPHLPLVLDASGQPLELDPRRFDGHDAAGYGMTDGQFAAAYAAELAYLNRRILEAARTLQGQPGRPDPIVVIMSDHGYNTDVADVAARLGNLFAARTPMVPGLLAPAPTPVNLMPTLLNYLLGTQFAFEPDRFFLSPSDHQLLELTEVTDPDAVAASP